MIDYTLYLSNEVNLEKIFELTDLSLDELELVVGRFNKNSKWAGKLRGEVCVLFDGGVYIRHHFTKNLLWRKI